MLVVAIAPGDFDGQVRFPGAEFDMPDGSTGTWFRPVGNRTPPEAAQPGRPSMTAAQRAEVEAAKGKAGAGVGTGEGHKSKAKAKAKHGDDMT